MDPIDLAANALTTLSLDADDDLSQWFNHDKTGGRERIEAMMVLLGRAITDDYLNCFELFLKTALPENFYGQFIKERRRRTPAELMALGIQNRENAVEFIRAVCRPLYFTSCPLH